MSAINFKNILFLDIETVPEEEQFVHLSEEKRFLFEQKTAYQRPKDTSVEDFYKRAGIWAEFGKIICISIGYFSEFDTTPIFRVTSFYGEETEILQSFKKLLETHFSDPKYLLCAHNGKEFDFPYIARRMIIHQISLPKQLQLFGKKPWEIPHLDTLEFWKFGDYKHYTSLRLLTSILGIPSPKTDIDGSQVAEVFYQEKNIERIVSYCERDTIAVAQLLLRFYNYPILQEENIIFVK